MKTKSQQIKELKEQVEKLTQATKKDWLNNQDIIRNLEYQVAVIKSNITDNDNNKQETPFAMINKNMIPENMLWRYWRIINDTTNYYTGRYMKIIPSNWKGNKLALMLTMYMGFLYGNTAYDKSTNKAYYIFKENGVTKGYEIKDILTYDNRPSVAGKKETKWNIDANFTKYEKITLNADNLALLQPRINKIGDYVWFLQDLCELIQIRQIIVANTPNLLTPLFISANNEATGEKLAKTILDTDKPVKIITQDIADLSNKDFKLIDSKLKLVEHSYNLGENQKDLILTFKFLQEEFYNRIGIPITSAKNQSLSADANLSVSTGETIRQVRDELVINFLKAAGIKVDISALEELTNIVPMQNRKASFVNENADKSGMGLNKNTNGDEVKK